MKRKILALLISCIMVMSFAVGCGKQSSKSSEDADTKQPATTADTKEDDIKEAVTIKYASFSEDDVLPIEQEIINNFQAQNELVKVKIEKYPAKEYETKIAVQLAGGADIDLYNMKENAQYADLTAKNQTLCIDEFISKDKFDVSGYGPLYEGLKIDGKLYGLPQLKSTWVLYYNKNLFDEAGVPYPKEDMTWNEFRELAKKMTKGEGNDKQWGAYIHTWPICTFGPARQKGASLIDEDLTPFKDVLQFRLDMEKDGSIMKYTELIATNAHYNAAFQKGNVAMNIIGNWHITQLRKAEEENKIDFDWDIISLPHPEGVSANTSWGMPTTTVINPKSEYKQQSWEFLKYLAGPEGAMVFAENGQLPAYSTKEITEAYVGDGSSKPANLSILTNQKVYGEYPPFIGVNTIVNTIYKQEFELTFAGEQTPEEAMEHIKQRIKEEVNN